MGKIMKHAILLSAVPVDAAMKRYCRPGSFVVACDAGYREFRLPGCADLIVGILIQRSLIPTAIPLCCHTSR